MYSKPQTTQKPAPQQRPVTIQKPAPQQRPVTIQKPAPQPKPATIQEYIIRVPKDVPRTHHVMRFNGNLDVNFDKWTKVKMERENNMKEYKTVDDDEPKFGAGSVFGKEAREEARRKKLGIIAKKYNADNQPWILKTTAADGASVKKFKGIREGGVAANTAYYVFTHAADGSIEAFPLREWYKFQPIQRYKALSAEEAEEEFNKRSKHLNYFSLMLKKRLKGDEAIEEEGEEATTKKGSSKKDKQLKISEMDEWMESSDDDDSDDEEKKEGDDEDEGKKKNKKADPKKNKKKRDTDVEAFEDSDDGDEEGRELDYISDSSESEPEDTNLESVAEEKALKKLLNSDDESDSDDSDKSDKESNEDENNKENKDNDEKKDEKDNKNKKNKKKVKKVEKKGTKEEDDDIFSSDSSSDEDDKKKSNKKDKKEKKAENGKKVDSNKKGTKAEKGTKESGAGNSSVTPTDNKRKLINDALAAPAAKKPKLEPIVDLPQSGITEDAVKKYLIRKPMTTTELLQKFKSKKTGLSSQQLVNVMTLILKRVNPQKQMLNGKMYLSIKP
ncbi:general transcription factor IIF subunit 1-like [Aethina tumida]|uniref:general transcription factor IIF subunit 1-like n=1 Tax=Aethina tumida TaxID=116153 RepID=UPI00214812CD|nr:general transcription factor IIF subunit 1-like [Aethina tumida]